MLEEKILYCNIKNKHVYILKWKGMTRAFQCRAGRLRRPTVASGGCLESTIDVQFQRRSCPLHGPRRGSGGRGSADRARKPDVIVSPLTIVDSRQSSGATVGLRRHPARRWKALIIPFHLSICFPGVCAVPGGANRTGVR